MGTLRHCFLQSFVDILGQTRLHYRIVENHASKHIGDILCTTRHNHPPRKKLKAFTDKSALNQSADKRLCLSIPRIPKNSDFCQAVLEKNPRKFTLIRSVFWEIYLSVLIYNY
jgi:hypothetical protein